MQHMDHDAVMGLVPLVDCVEKPTPEWTAADYIHISAGHFLEISGNLAVGRIRVDGMLRVNGVCRLSYDTIVVGMGGVLEIESGAHLDCRTDTDIDVSTDPQLLSRGIVSMGALRVNGDTKTPRGFLSSGAVFGANEIHLDERPDDWEVGDEIIICGTRYDGWVGSDHFPSQDERRMIVGFTDHTLFLNESLMFNHVGPRPDHWPVVVNMTRSVTFTVSDANCPVHRRAHLMAMGETSIRGASFHGFGRTDKSRDAVDATSLATVQADSNVKGRYGVHLHRNGFGETQRVSDVVIDGSPGWGIAHHDCAADILSCITFDCFGAGIVAETGNEIGEWVFNTAIYSRGQNAHSPKDGNDVNGSAFDLGRSGDGFWFQGRMVEAYDNIAVSCNTGFAYMHRGTGMLNPLAEHTDHEENYWGQTVGVDQVPIQVFERNEAIACNRGLHVTKAGPRQGHDVRTVMSDFKAWNCKTGAEFLYTGHYTLIDFDVSARDDSTHWALKPQHGISYHTDVIDMVLVNPKIEGFAVGLHTLPKVSRFSGVHPPNNDAGYVTIGAEFINCTTDKAVDAGDEFYDVAPPVAPLMVAHGMEYDGQPFDIKVDKVDSLGGIVTVPSHGDGRQVHSNDMVKLLETVGYWSDSGQNYFEMPQYYSDRLTGDVTMIPLAIPFFGDWQNNLGKSWSGLRDAVHNGEKPMSQPVQPEPEPEPPTELEAAHARIADLELELATVRDDNDDLINQIASLESQRAALLVANADLLNNLDTRDQTIASLNQTVEVLNADIAVLESQNGTLTAENEQMSTALTLAKTAIDEGLA